MELPVAWHVAKVPSSDTADVVVKAEEFATTITLTSAFALSQPSAEMLLA